MRFLLKPGFTVAQRAARFKSREPGGDKRNSRHYMSGPQQGGGTC